jgi:hypothetical protein
MDFGVGVEIEPDKLSASSRAWYPAILPACQVTLVESPASGICCPFSGRDRPTIDACEAALAPSA